jgi:hypothetical protein
LGRLTGSGFLAKKTARRRFLAEIKEFFTFNAGFRAGHDGLEPVQHLQWSKPVVRARGALCIGSTRMHDDLV